MEASREVDELRRKVAALEAAQAESARREELFRQFGENVKDVVWITAWPPQAVHYVSRAYERIWGRPCESLYANPDDWLMAIHSDDRDRVERIFMERIHQGGFDVEYRVVRPDGSVCWIRDRGFPVRDAAGTVQRVAGIAEDITERKNLQHQLDRHAENLEKVFLDRTHELDPTDVQVQSLYDSSPDFYAVLTPAGEVLHVNRGLAAGLARERDEMIGADAARFIAPASYELLRTAMGELRRTGKLDRGECQLIRADGSLVDTSLRASAEIGPAGEMTRLRVVLRDITRRKALQRTLAQTERMVNTGRLAASVAHEIHNPLQALLVHLSLVSGALPDDFAEHESWERVLEGAERIRQVVNDLLDLHRVGRQRKEPVDLNAIVLEALGLAGGQFRAGDIDVNVRLDESLPHISGVSQQLYQVVLNLLLNAAGAMDQGGRLEVTTRIHDGQVALEVRDDGPGMAPDELPLIFDPLYTSRKRHGTGLGLFVTDNLIKQHNGNIEVESRPDEGTLVRIILPTGS